jgi:Kef-type K+ transport system membrane component KefB/nucleotide-binding universal stress UspA family protein
MPAGLVKGTLLTLHFSLPLKDPVLIFSVVLFIILLAPIVLRKLRIPSIIGLILAGVAIGPHGFNLIARDSSIELFGTVGLLYIMFLAGLELDLNEFKRNRNKSLLFGALTFSFPFALGVAACIYVLHLSVTSSILIASMFSTHTLLSYPLASKMGITKNEAVTIAVGGTIITDTVVLLILAVITGAAKGTLSNAFWIRLAVSLVVFVSAVFFLFPPIGRWFFRNIKGDNVSEYIFILAMVFLAAFLAEAAGVEAIIGAFFAGLALNRLIPHTSPIMNRIDFVGNALFIPFFLIGVGMLVDLRILLHGPAALIVAATLTVVAFSGKWIAAFCTQKLFRFSALQRRVIFGLTSSHAAATLAVILIGFNIGLVNESVLNGTVILILITCLVSSFITENAGRGLALQQQESLPESEELKERILVPISNPDTIEQLMDLAVMLKDVRQQEPVYALTVVKDDEEAVRKVKLSRGMLESVIKHASATDTEVQIRARVDLSVASGITRAAKEINVTDLILGWSPKGRTSDRLFGSKLSNILENVWQTIYVCRFVHPLNTNRNIIVALPAYVQYEAGFSHLVRKIYTLAHEMGAQVTVGCHPKTAQVFAREIEKNKSSVRMRYLHFEQPEEMNVLSAYVTADDLFILVNARRGTISYDPFMETLLERINRSVKGNNFMLIYPEQHAVVVKETGLQPQDINLAPIQEQIENLGRLGKALRRIFTGQRKAVPPSEKTLPPEQWEDDVEEGVEKDAG